MSIWIKNNNIGCLQTDRPIRFTSNTTKYYINMGYICPYCNIVVCFSIRRKTSTEGAGGSRNIVEREPQGGEGGSRSDPPSPFGEGG